MSTSRAPRTQALTPDFPTQILLQMQKREDGILPKVTQRVNDRAWTVSRTPRFSGKVTTRTAERAIPGAALEVVGCGGAQLP